MYEFSFRCIGDIVEAACGVCLCLREGEPKYHRAILSALILFGMKSNNVVNAGLIIISKLVTRGYSARYYLLVVICRNKVCV